MAPQRLLVEELQRAQRLRETRPRQLPLAGQMEEVLAQLRFGQLVGRSMKMPGEARDHLDVRLDRPLGVAAEMEVVNQALAKGGHVILSGNGRRGSEQRPDTRSTQRDRPDQAQFYPPQAD